MNATGKCCICGRKLFSLTTRVVGNEDFCYSCGDAALKLVNEYITSTIIPSLRAVTPTRNNND